MPPKGVAVVLVALVLGLAAAQPGLCPCWLLADVGRVHPHLGPGPIGPHEHDYLSHWTDSSPPVGPPVLVPSVALLLALLAADALWRVLAGVGLVSRDACLRPSPRPPRGLWVDSPHRTATYS